MYQKFFKRFFDVILSGCALLVLWPMMLLVAIMVRIKLGSPVIFCQERPGKDGKIFKMYKFRSMSDARDENGNLLPDKMRLNRFGRILRSTSLDELPELFNILKGDMSIIGPRPLMVSYLEYYTDEERHRHDVRPGLSGLAQISGRNNLGWEERFRLDLEYIQTVSFITDVKIMIGTVMKVIRREGIGEGKDSLVGLATERRQREIIAQDK